MKERINEINARLAEIDTELRTADADKITALTAEINSLLEERGRATEQMAQEARAAMAQPVTTPIVDNTEEIEARARDLKQGRSVVISSLDLVSITHESETLNPAFNEVSTLMDAVDQTSFENGESYKKGYVKGYGEAGYTTEGTDYNEDEPEFGYAEINKAKLTVYTEVSEEVEKLSPKAYVAEVQKGLTIALKKKINKELINGAGTSNALVGIFTASKTTAIDTATDIAITAIDETTLDKIVYGYGGDEDFSAGVLILNKKTLMEFDTLRNAKNGNKVYAVDKAAKTINGVPYIITSACKPFATATATSTTAGDYVMAYGSLKNINLTQFGKIEIAKSNDYKFKQGMVAYRLSGFFGSNVVAFNGIVRVKKVKTA